jgi:hypothetical protein
MFVHRYEEHLMIETNNIFKNLPELLLSFLENSPVIKHFKGSGSFPYTYDAKTNSINAKLQGISIQLKNVENSSVGISSIIENTLLFKLRTCANIIASQIRGMNRHVPYTVKQQASSTPSMFTRLTKMATSAFSVVRGKEKKGTPQEPFIDLYSGKFLESEVPNQKTEPMYQPIYVKKSQPDGRLEMEHIIGVYQAALLFKDEHYAMTIFANLQIMSHESNNGVASTP